MRFLVKHIFFPMSTAFKRSFNVEKYRYLEETGYPRKGEETFWEIERESWNIKVRRMERKNGGNGDNILSGVRKKENGRINLDAWEHRPPAGFRHSCGPFDLSRVSTVHLRAFSQLNFEPHEVHFSDS